MKKLTALLLCAALATNACATAGGSRVASPAPASTLSTFAASLPPGTRVRVDLRAGGRLDGTLVHTTPDALVLQPATRLPEPPQTVAFADVTRIELHRGGTNLAKAIAIGAGVGAGVFFGMLLIVYAIIGDD